jgi:tetratricopeptide (TPR) repeat protein
VSISPADLDPLKNFGNVYSTQERHAEALTIFRRGIDIEDRLDYHYALQRSLHALRRYDESVAEGRYVVKTSTDLTMQMNANHVLGGTLRDQNRQDEALAAFEHAAEKVQHIPVRKRASLKNNEFLLSYGAMLQQVAKHTEAQVALQQAIEINPLSAPAFFNLANCLKAEKNVVGAIAEYGKALQLDPLLVGAWMNCANTLQDSGLFKKSMQHYQAAHQLVPTDTLIHAAYLRAEGRVLEEEHQFDAARQIYAKGASLYPDEGGFGVAAKNLEARSVSQDDYDLL